MISRTGRYRKVEVEEGELVGRGEGIGKDQPSLIRRMEVVFGSGMKRGRRDYVVWEEGIFGLKPPKRGRESGEGGRRKSLKREREEVEEEGDASNGREGVGPEEMLRSQSGTGGGVGVEELDVVDLEGAGDEGEGEGENGGGGSDQEDEFGDDSWMNGVEEDGWGVADGGVTSGTI